MQMDYLQAMDYIHSLLQFGTKPGLSRTLSLLERAGNPHKKLKCIHVAGTNGKGSTSAFIAAALQQQGYKVGLYISPYIHSFEERIQINRENINRDDLCSLVCRYKDYVDNMISSGGESPTEFEFVTALAFSYFANSDCDYVVLETGLGGRFDSTNVIEKPLVSVICSISLDHIGVLGDTVEKIAFEKLGIVKNNCPCVLYPIQDKSVFGVAKSVCESRESRLIVPDINSLVIQTNTEFTEFSNKFTYNGNDYNLSLMGEHQVFNAITAIEALKVLRQGGVKLDDRTIVEALNTTQFRGRFEILSHSPLLIVDGGHNPAAIDMLYKTLLTVISQYKITKSIIIMGMVSDKDYNYCIEKMSGISDIFFAVEPNSDRRLSRQEVARIAGKNCSDVRMLSLQESVQTALSIADDNTVILCCGSLYLIGDIKI